MKNLYDLIQEYPPIILFVFVFIIIHKPPRNKSSEFTVEFICSWFMLLIKKKTK